MAEEMNDQESTLAPENTTPEETTVEAEAQTESDTQPETIGETQKTLPPLTAERVTDITLGLGKAAVEALDKAARQLDDSVRQIRTDAPAFLEEMEEKGRPLREKLSENLRGLNVPDIFTRAGARAGAGAPNENPLDDIEALENRVRELEQQVSSEEAPPAPEATAEPSPFSMLELDDAPVVAQEEEAAKKPPVRRKKKDEESSAAE